MENTHARIKDANPAMQDHNAYGLESDIDETITLSADQILSYVERLIEAHPDQIPYFFEILNKRLDDL